MNDPTHSIERQWTRLAQRVAIGLVISTLSTFLTLSATARTVEEDPSVTSGGEALRARMQVPWYDADTDSLQPITLRDPWRPDWSLEWLAVPLRIGMYVVGVALLLILGWFVFRAIRERERGASLARATKLDSLVAADRVEALPFLRQRSHHDLLGQARRHYEQGNYSEAIIYLFSYQLVELDRCSLVRLAKGKTNRQYLREARDAGPLAGLLEPTMIAFEDAFFGQRALDRAGFEACWNQLGRFEDILVQSRQST